MIDLLVYIPHIKLRGSGNTPCSTKPIAAVHVGERRHRVRGADGRIADVATEVLEQAGVGELGHPREVFSPQVFGYEGRRRRLWWCFGSHFNVHLIGLLREPLKK